jgi:hypothetical protein
VFAYGETVTIQSPGTTLDPYSGDPVTAWDLDEGQSWSTEPSEVDVAHVGVEPRPSSEPVEAARNAVVAGFTLYFPPATTITAHNRVVVRGGTYNVLGDAADWRSPFTGWAPGVVVQVGRTEG